MKSKSKVLKDELVPFFSKRQYKERGFNYASFAMDRNEKVTISFEFMPMNPHVLETTICHPKIDDCIKLPALIDGPGKVRIENGFWLGFDTIDELLGLLRFQERLFDEWILAFLAEEKYIDVFDEINKKRKERIGKYSQLSQKEQFELIDRERGISEHICNMRFL